MPVEVKLATCGHWVAAATEPNASRQDPSGAKVPVTLCPVCLPKPSPLAAVEFKAEKRRPGRPRKIV